MSSGLAREYAQRSQASNIFSGAQQPEVEKTGKRIGNKGEKISQVFGAEGANNSEVRDRPAPAPFLTDDNAVNTHGRRGGFVNPCDSFLEGEEYQYQVQPEYQVEPEYYDQYYQGEQLAPEQTDQMTAENLNQIAAQEEEEKNQRYNENGSAARTHKHRNRDRNQTSHIFDSPDAPNHKYEGSYDRKQMSNVF